MASTTTIRLPLRVRVALCTGDPLAGAVLGAGAALLVEWLAQASSVFDGVLGVGAHVGEPVAVAVLAGIGLLVGLVLAVSVLGESLRAQVGGRAITLEWDDARVSVPRPIIRSIVLADDLVLLGPGDVELARVRCDVDRADLRRALAAHGYPEPVGTDPNAEAFAPVRPAGGLGEQDLRLLSARAEAVAAGDHGDAELLRRQLAARGIMVRDVHRPGRRSTGQQWRAVESLLVPHAAAA